MEFVYPKKKSNIVLLISFVYDDLKCIKELVVGMVFFGSIHTSLGQVAQMRCTAVHFELRKLFNDELPLVFVTIMPFEFNKTESLQE